MLAHGTQVLKFPREMEAPQFRPPSSAEDNDTEHRRTSGCCQFLCLQVGIGTVYHGSGVLCHGIDGLWSYHRWLVGRSIA